jgi:hypothetical protein
MAYVFIYLFIYLFVYFSYSLAMLNNMVCGDDAHRSPGRDKDMIKWYSIALRCLMI